MKEFTFNNRKYFAEISLHKGRVEVYIYTDKMEVVTLCNKQIKIVRNGNIAIFKDHYVFVPILEKVGLISPPHATLQHGSSPYLICKYNKGEVIVK